jgi:hypothetical protein
MSSASDPCKQKDRSRTPPPVRGDAIAKEFDDMWASMEPKLDIFKEGVKDAVKGMVVSKIEDLENRMDKKFDEVKAESLAVKGSKFSLNHSPYSDLWRGQPWECFQSSQPNSFR